MINAPIPDDEVKRLKAVIELGILDTEPEKRFDQITSLATKLFDVPISTVTIMDEDREWYKSCQGLDARESPRAISFCGHAIASKESIMIVQDTTKDPRFFDNPLVIGPPYIRFYAGVPIFTLSEQIIGVFCIKDTKPRALENRDSYLLQTLASWAEIEINIINLRDILEKKNDDTKLKTILDRLINRNVIENMKSIQFILKLKLEKQSFSEVAASEKAIGEIIKLIVEIEQALITKDKSV